jgi:hypothetical protein
MLRIIVFICDTPVRCRRCTERQYLVNLVNTCVLFHAHIHSYDEYTSIQSVSMVTNLVCPSLHLTSYYAAGVLNTVSLNVFLN